LPEKDPWMPDEDLSQHQEIICKLVCGADVLETFNVEGLWSDEDVSLHLLYFLKAFSHPRKSE
jgi:hypothetical protein